MVEERSEADEAVLIEELREAWAALSPDERNEGFHLLDADGQEEFFLRSDSLAQADLLSTLPDREAKTWCRALAPDDAADLVQATEPERRGRVLSFLDESAKKEVSALLAYKEDRAGGLMNPRYGRVRPDMTVDEAISYLRRQQREMLEATYYVYVLDGEVLLGVISFRTLFLASPTHKVREIMATDLVTVPEQMDQEQVSRLFREHDLLALPVVDADKRMKGIVTVDDIVDVVDEEATEDAQKFGGMEALDAPYMAEPFWRMIKKRGGWLAALFIGEMLTATAMGYFQDEIAKAVVLALFMPLIISSGGNSGSQASTLVIRAMALGEVRLRDWFRVMRRELAAGFVLGAFLGVIGLMRIAGWSVAFSAYGEHWPLIAATVGLSLIGVVMIGTLAGSMLPFLLRRAGLDPASASAPFVATLVDVAGLVIYFTVAAIILAGQLL
ncbi:MAG: magnesium transporter [Myxococcota bacterium]